MFANIYEDRYEMVRCDDVHRGGMYLEFWDRATGEQALEAFYSDVDGSMEFTKFRPDVPIEVEAWFRQQAHALLPKIQDDKRATQP